MAEYSMKDEHRDLLQKHRIALVTDLEPSKLLNHMTGSFDPDDREEISACTSRSARADKMLDFLPRKGPKAFEEFVRALMNKQKHLGELLLKESGLVLSPLPSEVHGMAEQHREILQRNAPALCNMDLKQILPLMVMVIDQQEANQIMEIEDKSSRVHKFLDILTRQGPKAFDGFIRVLQIFHPELAKPLMQEAGMQAVIKTARPGTNDEHEMSSKGLPEQEENARPYESSQKAQPTANCNSQTEKDNMDKAVTDLTEKMSGLSSRAPDNPVPRYLGDLDNDKLIRIANKIEKGDWRAVLTELRNKLGQEERGTLPELLQYAQDLPIRQFTGLLRSKDRLDVIRDMREFLPKGTTGPLRPESTNIRHLAFSVRRDLAKLLCVGGRWIALAENINMKPVDIQYLETNKKIENPAEEVLRFWEVKSHSTVKHMYDKLVELGNADIADTL